MKNTKATPLTNLKAAAKVKGLAMSALHSCRRMSTAAVLPNGALPFIDAKGK